MQLIKNTPYKNYKLHIIITGDRRLLPKDIGNKKALKPYDFRDEKIAVPPWLLCFAKPLSDSNKSIADNGATVLHYCQKGSQSRLGKQSA